MPLSAASDLGLHCLPMLHKKDARLRWVNTFENRAFTSSGALQEQFLDFCCMQAYTHFNVFCTKNPATTAIVVGKLAAHTPSRFNVFSSVFVATTRGGAH